MHPGRHFRAIQFLFLFFFGGKEFWPFRQRTNLVKNRRKGSNSSGDIEGRNCNFLKKNSVT